MNLTKLEREQLQSIVRSRAAETAHARRSKLSLQTASHHTSEQFVAFLANVIATQEGGREIHVICDNVSSHKTERVRDFMDAHCNVQIHHTPTYSSWLNQVENWFSKIQRDVITRGVFTSVKDLDRKLMRYIRANNKDPKPIKWKYDDPSRRIRPVLFQ